MTIHSITNTSARPNGVGSKRVFARHFAEMLVVMLLGMGMLEGLAALAFTAAGSSLTGQPGAFRVILMGLSTDVTRVGSSAGRYYD